MNTEGEIILYQSENSTQVEVRIENETVWLTQEQMSILFHKATSTISEHIKNIYKEGELQTISAVRKIRIAQNEGMRPPHPLAALLTGHFSIFHDFYGTFA